MAGRIPPEFVDQVLARTDVVDVISARVELRKAGKDFQARCPFHEEKTPSFTVSADKQFYYCFGCGAHGTAIGFLMEYDRLDFREAVEELAKSAGLPMPGDDTGPPPRDLTPLFDLHERAARLFRDALREHPEAIDYLKGRGLSGEIALRFGVGFAPPGWDFLLGKLGGSAATISALIECGLVVERDGKRYDRFRNRIMFPIRDRRGRTIAFGGRVLGDDKPKYLNSPETPLFHKGRGLYGLFEALQAKRRPERLILVEGYMDVIALAQFEIPYAVATLGTATTTEQLERLLKTSPEVLFCFDGDRAGRAAAWKALQVALPVASGKQQIRFLFLPDGEDPDTLVRGNGREALEARMSEAKPLSELFFDQLCNGLDTRTIEGRAKLTELARPLIARMPEGVYRQMIEARLSALTGIAPPRPAATPRPRPFPSRGAPVKRHNLRTAIALLLADPSLIRTVDGIGETWRRSDRPGVPLLATLVDRISAYPGTSAAELVGFWQDDKERSILERLATADQIQEIDPQYRADFFSGILSSLARAVQVEAIEAERAELDALITQGGMANLSPEQRKRYGQIPAELNQLKRPPAARNNQG